jgi:hypothetical protein
MRIERLAILILVALVAWLGWSELNMALEVDGLKQNAQADRRSIEALLAYAKVASRCDLKPEELAKALNASVYPSQGSAGTRVATLAFDARFSSNGPREVGIVDVAKVSVCSP